MKRLFGRLTLSALAAVVLTLAVVSASAQAAPGSHTQKEVNESIEKGVAYLDTQQNLDGSFGVGAPISETGMALSAYGVLANGNFESLSATYQEHVKKAIEYLLKEQSVGGSWADGSGFLQTYATGIALAGLEVFKGVNAGIPAAIKKGREFLETEFKGAPTFTCSSEEASLTASWCGGWSYDSNSEEARSDESNTGFAMFGLHQTGGVPAGIAKQNVGWQHHIQEIKSNPFAKRNDGGGCYQPQAEETFPGRGFCSNANNTGSMLFGFGYDGVKATDEGVKAGITFAEDVLNEYELEKEVSRTMLYHSGEKEDGTCKIGTEGCDWAVSGDGGYHYSLFALTKGLGEFATPKLEEAGNFYAKVVDLLLTQQGAGGSWPADGRDDAESAIFATSLAVSSLGLVGVEKEPANCGNTTVGKISDRLLANVKRVNACTLPTNGTATELSVYLTPTSTSGQQLIKGIVYADVKGKPVGLLGTTTQLAFTSKSPAGWYHLTFPTPVKLAAGNYWIGIISGVSKFVAAERYESVKIAEDYNTNTYTSGPSNPFGSFKTTNEQMSLYLTYRPS